MAAHNLKAKLQRLHDGFAALAEQVRAELGGPPPALPELKAHQVVQLLLWKAEMWKRDLACAFSAAAANNASDLTWDGTADSDADADAQRAERELAVLRRVYDTVVETAWSGTDADVLAAVRDDLRSIHLLTIYGGEYTDGRPYWEGEEEVGWGITRGREEGRRRRGRRQG